MLQQMRAKAAYIWIIIAVVFVGGFLFAQTSGLLGRGPVTTSTVVAKVNGTEIPYTTWANVSAQMAQQREQQLGHGLSLDERRQVDEAAFNQLVGDVLLQQEYARRGIRVTDAEIVEMAKYSPPPQFMQLPELMTEGRFDPAKYQRFLASPAARQQGILLTLENYYRTEIPKQKLFAQVAGDAYLSDARLWLIWRDTHDSATVSFVAYRPVVTAQDKAAVSEADIQKYYNDHAAEYDRPGTATLSIVSLSRRPTAADTQETLRKIQAIREELVKGAKFEDVAKRESDDSTSAVKGGDLGKSVKGTFVKPFEEAEARLAPGQLSQPVKSDYGYHLIRVDKRQGDSTWSHHILKLVKQGDSAAAITDRHADTLAKLAAGSDQPAKFDDAAKKLGLLVSRITVREGQPAEYLTRAVPSASAWAFSGARPGETSDLFDDDAGYYLVRLDSIRPGGKQDLALVKDEIRDVLARKKAVEVSVPQAQALASAAAGSTLEAAAKEKSLTVSKVGPFARSSTVADFGFVSEVTGAALTLPVNTVSAPIRTDDAVYVIRVDKRVQADSTKWAQQKALQRMQVTNAVREQRVRMFLENLRKAAKVDDRRKSIQSAQRRTGTAS